MEYLTFLTDMLFLVVTSGKKDQAVQVNQMSLLNLITVTAIYGLAAVSPALLLPMTTFVDKSVAEGHHWLRV